MKKKTLRPTYVPAGYGYESAYKAYDVPDDLREYYQEFNLQKIRANRWFRDQDIPLLLRFRPCGEYRVDSVWSNMTLELNYILPTGGLYRFHNWKLSKNEIKLKCFRNELLRMSFKPYSMAMQHSAHLLQVIKDCELRVEADKAYELAYQSNL